MSSKSKYFIRRDIPIWRSLSVKTSIATLLIVLIIGFSAAFAAMQLFRTILAYETKSDVWNLAKAEVAILDSDKTMNLAEEVMTIYDSFTEEERGDGTSDAYKEAFRPVLNKYYKQVQADMRVGGEEHSILNCCIIGIDQKYNRIVYIADSDSNMETFCWPGTWDEYSDEDIDAMLHGAKLTPTESLLGLDDGIHTIWDHRSSGTIISGFAKLCDAEGYEVFICMDKRISHMAQLTHKVRVIFGFFLALVSFGVAILMGYSLRRTIVRPIDEMARAANAYSDDKKSMQQIKSHHFADLDIHTKDEIENLSQVMKEMEEDMAEYIQNMRDITADKERINTELSVATKIQAAMLPSNFPAFPERTEFDLYASMEPAREVGGDFYDFYMIDDDHLCVLIADVSGKGIPAALFMMAVRIILKNKAQDGHSPAEILAETNEMVCGNNPGELFVTVWIGILEISTGKITAANAGHEKPVIIRPDGQAEMIQDKHGFVVGGMEGMKYSEYELQLEPGSRLFLYTDGVTEATIKGSTLYGKDRMMAAASSCPGADPQQTLEKIRSDVDAFVGDEEQFDDLTLLCLEYKG